MKEQNKVMSAGEFLHKKYFEKTENVKAGEFYPISPTTENILECERYANYILSQRIDELAERIAENAEIYSVGFSEEICIDKSSIIKIANDFKTELNLNK